MIVPEPAWSNVPVIPPGEEVALYEVIVAPPLEPGDVKATVAIVDQVAVAVPIVGAPGITASVVIEFEVADANDSPALFVAVTVNVYKVPGVNPLTVIVPEPA